MRIRSIATIDPYAVKEVYIVSPLTISSDKQRSCWICEGPFNIGDGMTLAFMRQGKNKCMHTKCYQEQVEEVE